MKGVKFSLGKSSTVGIIIALIIALVLITIFIKTTSKDITNLQNLTAPCIPMPGCHPKSCIFAVEEVQRIFCTQECAPGSLDCGQGSCQVINGTCKAVFK